MFLVPDVIDFRLESVIIPRCFRFRSSSLHRVYDDYYFHVYGRLAVWSMRSDRLHVVVIKLKGHLQVCFSIW